MKFLSATTILCSIFFLSGSAVSSRLPSIEARGPTDPQACGDPTLLVPFFRLWNPTIKDDFYTASVTEKNAFVASQGYVYEGVAGYIWPSSEQPQTIPLYRIFNGNPGVGNHFYTTSTAERDAPIINGGYVSEGIAGYVYNDTLCGGLPFYRLWSQTAQNDFYTMSATERDYVVTHSEPDVYVYEKIGAWIIRF
ncbi:hypothetical protein CPC08DRAFT_824728 [Agrocybe pediades]|nr:hypothetical protein CPC08DRAFT_824728 [Agrocybe pediades]